MEAVLGIDLGTSYFKAGVFSRKGDLLGLARVPVVPESIDWIRCEVSTLQFRKYVVECISAALRESKCGPNDIKGVSYSSQANSFLLLDKNSTPLTPIFLWTDRRSIPTGERVGDYPGKELFLRKDFLLTTGIDITGPQGCVPKLLWVRKNSPEIWEKTASVMNVSDYLTFLFTGTFSGDAGTASLLGLLDLKRGDWWEDGFEQIEVSSSLFSTPLPPGTVAGDVTPYAAAEFHLKPGIPFAVGSLDHHVAALGAGAGVVSDFVESTGTVIACFTSLKDYAPLKGCAMGPGFQGQAPYYRLAFHDCGAVVLDWYSRNFVPDVPFEVLVHSAKEVPPGSGGLTALPCAHLYPDLQGFIGKGKYTPGYYIRASMESVAATLKGLLKRMVLENTPESMVATGGGAKSDLWLSIKAGLIGCDFITTLCPEPATSGAGILAGTAAGWADNPVDLSHSWFRVSRRVSPDSSLSRIYTVWYDEYRRILQRQKKGAVRWSTERR